MNLIIKIDDDIAKGIRGENECEVEPREIVRSFQATIADAIKNGTPYTTSGDLISREALKNDISEKVCDKFDRWDKTITCAEFETFIIDVINDAPTIEFSPVINMKPLTAEEKQGLIDALKKSRLKVVKLDDEGIRGEWEDYSADFYKCPECGYLLNKLCPQCYNKVILPKGGKKQ